MNKIRKRKRPKITLDALDACLQDALTIAEELASRTEDRSERPKVVDRAKTYREIQFLGGVVTGVWNRIDSSMEEMALEALTTACENATNDPAA